MEQNHAPSGRDEIFFDACRYWNRKVDGTGQGECHHDCCAGPLNPSVRTMHAQGLHGKRNPSEWFDDAILGIDYKIFSGSASKLFTQQLDVL